MRARSSSEPMRAATARASYENPALVRSPLFSSLTEKLAEDRRWVILDIGAVRPETVAVLSDFRCRLDIADLGQAINTLAASTEDSRLDYFVAALPAPRSPEPVDMVLTWDYLNYLDRDAIAALMAEVARRCRRGALVHALIVYSERLMQQQPGEFVAANADHILNRSTAKADRIAPRYSPDDLTRCMQGYKTERVRLLANGMQEYLFKVS
jgi:hypothetical protein